MELLLTIETPHSKQGRDADQRHCQGDSRHSFADGGRYRQKSGKGLQNYEAQADADNRAQTLALGLPAGRHLGAMAGDLAVGLVRAHEREPGSEAVAAQGQAMDCSSSVNPSPGRWVGTSLADVGAALPQAEVSTGAEKALAISGGLLFFGGRGPINVWSAQFHNLGDAPRLPVLDALYADPGVKAQQSGEFSRAAEAGDDFCICVVFGHDRD